jgi:hypothetical protein
MMNIKIILQQLWKLKVNWDDEIPNEIANKWKAVVSELNSLKSANINRFILTANFTKLELHGFADASQSAYGAYFYVKSHAANNQIKCSLLCVKSKMAPIERVTIPKLELAAATSLAELYA